MKKSIKVTDVKHLKREIYKCYNCDCETFPYCIATGKDCEFCDVCFDSKKFRHRMPDIKNPGLFLKDQLVPEKKVSVTHKKITIVRMPSDGDCLYNTFVKALDCGVTVEDLRYLVSRCQTHESYAAYKYLADSGVSEFKPVRATKTLREFKNIIQYTGQRVGAEGCVWGDENAIRVLSNTFRLGILVFNEKGKLTQSIKPEEYKPRRWMLIRLNGAHPGNEHYDLLQFNRKSLLTEIELKALRSIISNK